MEHEDHDRLTIIHVRDESKYVLAVPPATRMEKIRGMVAKMCGYDQKTFILQEGDRVLTESDMKKTYEEVVTSVRGCATLTMHYRRSPSPILISADRSSSKRRLEQLPNNIAISIEYQFSTFVLKGKATTTMRKILRAATRQVAVQEEDYHLARSKLPGSRVADEDLSDTIEMAYLNDGDTLYLRRNTTDSHDEDAEHADTSWEDTYTEAMSLDFNAPSDP